jgi:hypothetical protein
MQRSFRRGPTNRIAVCALLLGIAADLSYPAAAQAQEDQSPGGNGSAPASAVPRQQPPDQQATGDSPTPDWQPGKLLQLPPYTRPRMHECALEWQKMKASGTATEKIWFTFAQSCLVR